MKKILFVCYGLGIGGIEKCLVNLVNCLANLNYDITIAPMNPEYALKNEVNGKVKILPFDNYFINSTDSWHIISLKENNLKKIYYIVQYIIYRLVLKFGKKPWLLQKSLKDEFDIAIAYSHTGYVVPYTIDKVKAKRKILWYHTSWIDLKNLKFYSKFDHIVAVSKQARDIFINAYPSLKNKTEILYNFYDIEDIKQKANNSEILFDKKRFNIVTVGRLSPEKGVDLAIKCAAELKKIYNFCWYWVGGGPLEKQAKKMIKDLHLCDNFILLGNQSNPYQYMKQADIYVQPSYREAFCTTTIEAKILNKPIVVTNVDSFLEQFTVDYDVLISDFNEKLLAEKIGLLVEDDSLRKKLSNNCNYDLTTVNMNLERYISFFEEVVM